MRSLVPHDRIDELAEAFEDALSVSSNVDLRDYLPAPSDPAYAAIATELMRVDMHYGLRQNPPRRLGWYMQEFPALFEDKSCLAQLAYEEYRLRRMKGESATPHEYSQEFEIETHQWPTFGDSTVVKSAVNESTYVIAAKSSTPGSVSSHSASHRRPTEDSAKHLLSSLEAGDVFGSFVLLHEVGRGAISRVFLAQQQELSQRTVVLKIALQDQQTVELQHLARLQNSHIVPLYSAHTVRGLTAVCMPYLGSTTLADYLRYSAQQTKLPQLGFVAQIVHRNQQQVAKEVPRTSKANGAATAKGWPSDTTYVRECERIILQVAEGLRSAHAQNLIHGDVKPANILLGDHGSAMLLDFNLSQSTESNASRLVIGGTLPYLSPEQLEALFTGDRVDHRSDLYSLGVVFYQMLTGRLPFESSSEASAAVISGMIRERRSTWTSAREVNRDVPPAVDAIITRLIAPEVEARYSSAEALIEDLENDLADRPLRHAVNHSKLELAQKWCRRHPRLSSVWSVGTLSFLLVAALTFSLVTQSRQYRRKAFRSEVQQLGTQLQAAHAFLTIPNADPVFIREGLERTRTSLQPFLSRDGERLRLKGIPAGLPESEQQNARELIASAVATYTEYGTRFANASLLRDADLVDSLERFSEVQAAIARPSSVAGDGTSSASRDSTSLLKKYELTKDTQRLISDLEAYRAASPHDYSRWMLLANAYVRGGRLRDAEACYSACVVVWQDSSLPLFMRGICRFDLGEFQQSAEDFTSVIQQRPDLATAWLNRAAARYQLRKYEQSLNDLDQAEQLGLKLARMHFMRSESLQRLKRLDEAELEFQRALSTEPTDTKSWIRRGLALIEQDPEKALSDFDSAARLSPGSREAQLNACYVLAEKLARQDEAIVRLGHVIEDFGFARDRSARAVYYARSGNLERAFDDIEQALKQEPDDATIRFQAACVYALATKESSDFRLQAIANLKEAIRLQPTFVYVAETDADLSELRTTRDFQSVLKVGRAMAQQPPAS